MTSHKASPMADDPDETVLDASGLKCPLPVLKARKAMKRIAAGGRLSVLVTDPKAPDDFRHFCETTGDALESVEPLADGHRIVLRKAG